MDSPFADSPENIAAVNSLLEQIDPCLLAERMNEITKGSLLERDALNVARLVGLAALRSPERTIMVAGLAGEAKDGRLRLWLVVPVAEMRLPHEVATAAKPKPI